MEEKHDWWQTSASAGPGRPAEHGYTCRHCGVRVLEVGRHGKRILVPGPDRGLPAPGPECPDECLETEEVMAAYEVHHS